MVHYSVKKHLAKKKQLELCGDNFAVHMVNKTCVLIYSLSTHATCLTLVAQIQPSASVQGTSGVFQQQGTAINKIKNAAKLVGYVSMVVEEFLFFCYVICLGLSPQRHSWHNCVCRVTCLLNRFSQCDIAFIPFSVLRQ
ncbi:unnamed protein product [Cylicocyclus nassatus]|uniref:Uncharacterized protein n=1 Tax=Cylicocyclus nassatus TaxID=53992 RepID=A0AA36MGT1_CYLNA|nr:unnamed protein product [Cylicocyclus nassatus]